MKLRPLLGRFDKAEPAWRSSAGKGHVREGMARIPTNLAVARTQH